MLAQQLYEGVELGKEGSVGLITYMRTDSTRVSDDALDEVRGIDRRALRASSIVPDAPNVYKSKKDAQDAHEAIRPTSAMRTPESRREVSGRRRAEAVPADLDALRGVADDAGGVRSDDHRRQCEGQRRQRVSVPRHRQRAEIRRLSEGLRGRQGPEGRRRRGAEEQAAGRHAGRSAEVQSASSPSSISPSRRRDSTKRRW